MFIVVIGSKLEDFFDSIYQQLSAPLKKSVDIAREKGASFGFQHCQSRSMGMLYINELFAMQLYYDIVGDPLISPSPVFVGSLSQLTIHFNVPLAVSPLFDTMKYVI